MYKKSVCDKGVVVKKKLVDKSFLLLQKDLFCEKVFSIGEKCF